MAITYSFVDNEAYGTDDINDIAKSLVGAGVAPFAAKDTYSTSDLNALTAALTDSGVSADGCKCTIEGSTVTVAQGIVYFENGVRMVVDEDGYEVEVPSATAGYVYAAFNVSLQTAEIAFGEELPQTGYYVLLAEISSAGALSDKRSFARSKIATLGTNAAVEFVPSAENNCTFAADLSKFNYVIIPGSYVYGGTCKTFWGLFDLKTNTCVYGLNSGSNSSDYHSGYIKDSTLGFTLSVTDGKLVSSLAGVRMILV